MEAFKTVIWIINIFSSLAIIGLVLMQHGKGADAGAGFSGSGSAQGVFGSAGNANFLSRMTALGATIFFASCLALGYLNTNSHNKTDLDFSDVKQTSQIKDNLPLSNGIGDNSHTAASTPVVAKDKVMASDVVSSTHSISDVQKAAVATTAAGAVTKKLISDDTVKDNKNKDNKNEKSQSKEIKSALKDKKTVDKKKQKHEKSVKKH